MLKIKQEIRKIRCWKIWCTKAIFMFFINSYSTSNLRLPINLHLDPWVTREVYYAKKIYQKFFSDISFEVALLKTFIFIGDPVWIHSCRETLFKSAFFTTLTAFWINNTRGNVAILKLNPAIEFWWFFCDNFEVNCRL